MRQKFLAILGAAFVLLLTITPSSVFAVDTLSTACNDPITSANSSICQDKNQNQTVDSNSIFGPEGVVGKAMQIVVYLIGIMSVIMIMLGGFTYITGSGDPNTLSGANKTILYAVIGVVVTIIAQTIVVLVINKL